MKNVVLYGKSLVMSTVAASLQACPQLHVQIIDPTQPDVQQVMSTIQPDAVIFDLEATKPEFLLSLLQQPDLLLIGLNAEAHKALLWSGKQAAAVAANDLVKVIVDHQPTRKE